MKSILKTLVPIAWLLSLWLAFPVSAQYPAWKHSGALTILTTPEGASLPASAVVEQFPLLVRLNRDWFDFSQTKPGGDDIRFSSASGEALAFEIDEWDAAQGVASIWVRMPVIRGNERQALRMHWGNPEVTSESNGQAVFNESNGYRSVWHLSRVVADAVGTLPSKDNGTTLTTGMVGFARHFAGGQGVFGGDTITNYPSGGAAHTTETWFRTEQPNVTLVGWGNEGGGRGSKVRMQLRSPPHLRIDSDFSDIKGQSPLPLGEWIHVVHTYGDGPRRLYINGLLDGEATTKLDIKSPARLWLGGWYDHYDFIGDLDEVRVSSVARSAAWVRLEYENQKRLQTLVGPLVTSGPSFSVSPSKATVPEGTSLKFMAQADGAQKTYWSVVREGRESVQAVDSPSFQFNAWRVTGDQTATLRFRAVFSGETKTLDIPITLQEAIPDPVFTLQAPAEWDGRRRIEVVPQIRNLEALRSSGAGELKMKWSAGPLAVTQETTPDRLTLTRAQNSGTLTVTATLSNGGLPVTQSVTLKVMEPEHDAWVSREPAAHEIPEDNQFYARDDRNEGTLIYRGTLSQLADAVYLRVAADGKPYSGQRKVSNADGRYEFEVKLKPGLVRYSVEFGTVKAGIETLLYTATNLVCGDAYLLQGQSNAVATDWGEGEPTFRSDWIRSFGSMSGNPEGLRLWGNAVHRSRDEEKLAIGYWGMELARRLVENHQIPICILNGAVGGTRIDQHQRNPKNPEDRNTIYGRLLWRVRQAKLTHGIRGVFWYQGENDQGADGPIGGYGWETYRELFLQLAGAWKQDFPNLQRYYVFQIWPKSCSMGIDGSDNRLREVQRTLPTAFSKMSLMSTLGVQPPGECHYPAAGYADIARLICPLVERYHYGSVFTHSIMPPNLIRARYTSDRHDEIMMEFDQPVIWNDALVSQFFVDGQKGKIVRGSVVGTGVTLTLGAPLTARTITYLDGNAWSPKNLLRGVNGIAALTFCDVPIESR